MVFLKFSKDKKEEDCNQRIKELQDKITELTKQLNNLQKQKIYKVKEKNIFLVFKVLAILSIIIPLGILALALILGAPLLLSIAMFVPAVLVGVALYMVIFNIPWVKTLVEYYLTNKKLVLVFDPEKKRAKLVTWVEKDGFLFNDNQVPIVVDDESIYTIAKGHQIYLYLEGRVKTFVLKKVLLEVIDEATERKIVYSYEPAIVLTTSDVERIFKRVKAEKVSKELQMLEENKGGIKIGNFNIPWWLIVAMIVIIFIVIAGVSVIRTL